MVLYFCSSKIFHKNWNCLWLYLIQFLNWIVKRSPALSIYLVCKEYTTSTGPSLSNWGCWKAPDSNNKSTGTFLSPNECFIIWPVLNRSVLSKLVTSVSVSTNRKLKCWTIHCHKSQVLRQCSYIFLF